MPVVEVTSVTLDRASLEVEVGKLKKLSATVNPSADNSEGYEGGTGEWD